MALWKEWYECVFIFLYFFVLLFCFFFALLYRRKSRQTSVSLLTGSNEYQEDEVQSKRLCNLRSYIYITSREVEIV